METLALTTATAVLIIFFVTIPVAAAMFAMGAGRGLRELGKGGLSVEFDSDLEGGSTTGGGQTGEVAAREREDELRQLLEAKAYRQSTRGEEPLDVDAELDALLRQETHADPGADPQLREEVRQLVVARNERRERQGKEPLDVDAEVERQLRELEGLGQ